MELNNIKKQTVIQLEQSGGEVGDGPVSNDAMEGCSGGLATSENSQSGGVSMLPPSTTRRSSNRTRPRAGPLSSKGGSREPSVEGIRSRSPSTRRPLSSSAEREKDSEPHEEMEDDVVFNDAASTSSTGSFSEMGPKAQGILLKALGKTPPPKELTGIGKAVTTGDWVGKRLALREKQRIEAEDREHRLEQEIGSKLRSAVKIFSNAEEEEALTGVPTAELGNSAAESLGVVVEVARSSKNLKGTFIRKIKIACANIQVVVDELSKRTYAKNSEHIEAAALEDLRARLNKSEKERKRMEEELEQIRKAPPPPPSMPMRKSRPPSPDMDKERACRRKRVRTYAESDEEGWGTAGWNTSHASPSRDPSPQRTHDDNSAANAGVGGTPSAVVDLERVMESFLLRIEARFDGKLEGLRRELMPLLPSTSTKADTPRRDTSATNKAREKSISGAPLTDPSLNPPTLAGRRDKDKKGKKKKANKSLQKPALEGQQEKEKPGFTPKNSRPAATEMERELLPDTGGRRPPLQHEQLPAPKETWATVTRRGAKKKEPSNLKPPLPQPPKKGQATLYKNTKRTGGRTAPDAPTSSTVRTRRPPRSAAVAINCPPEMQEEVVREAKAKIDLASLGIEAVRPRRTLTGILNYEVAGEGGEAKADALAAKLRENFAGRPGIVISRPTKMAELRLTGLDDTTTAEEISSAVAKEGGCNPPTISVGEIKKALNGLGAVWVRCPLVAANKIAKANRLKIGWIWVRAVLLDERPLQCYKCLEGGHVRAHCPNEADRSTRCYRCGEADHKAQACKAAEPKCPVCSDLGRPATHRAGGKACLSTKPKRGGHRAKPQPPSRERRKEAAPPSMVAALAPPEVPPSPMEVETKGGDKREGAPSSPGGEKEPASKRRKQGKGKNPPPHQEKIGAEDAQATDPNNVL